MDSWWRRWWRMIYTVWTVGEIPKIELKDTRVWSMNSWWNTKSKNTIYKYQKQVYHGISIPVDLRMGRPSPLPLPSLAMAPPFPTHTPVYGDKWLLSVLGKSTRNIVSLGFNGRWMQYFQCMKCNMINMQMRCSQYDMLTNSIKYSIRVVPSEANQSNDVKVYPVV